MPSPVNRGTHLLVVCVLPWIPLGCGARTPLSDGTSDAARAVAPDASLADAFAQDGKTDSALAETGPDVVDAATADVADDAPITLPCILASAGDPFPVLTFVEKHSEAPAMVVLDPGQPPGPSGERPALIAMQAFASGGSYEPHDDIRLARIRIEPAWPKGVVIDAPPVSYGVESHGWGEMCRAPGSINGLALAWHSDTGGIARPVFRSWDVASWSAGSMVDIQLQGEAVLDLVAGASTGAFGVGYSGDGYAVAWRQVDYAADGGSPTRPAVAVLDSAGNVMLGPHPASGYLPYPGKTPSLSWSGSAYLSAISYRDCPSDDPLCVERSVVVSRVRPASGDAWDDSGIEKVTAFGAASVSTTPGRPAMASWKGTTWIGWFEADMTDDKLPRRLRLARVGPMGDSLGAPLEVAQQEHPISSLSLSISDVGVSLSWAEDGDPSLPQSQLGRSRIVVHLLDTQGVEAGPPVRLPATQYNDYGWTPTVGIAHPRGLLVTWSGMDIGGGYWKAFLGRLECEHTQ